MLSFPSLPPAFQAFLSLSIIAAGITVLIAMQSLCSRIDALPLLAAITSIQSAIGALIGMAIVANINKDGGLTFAYGFIPQCVAIVIMLVNAIVMGASWHARKGNKVLTTTGARV